MNACERCGAPAMISIANQSETTWLCDDCVRASEITPGLYDLLRSFILLPANKQSCPYCGWSATDLEQTELLGCPLCYESLKSPLLKLVERPK